MAGRQREKKRGRRPRVLTVLGNETGASLVAAILFFVLCGVGASVILAASSASAGKMRQVPKADQKRFAVESAATFLRDEMKDGKNKITITDVMVKDSRKSTPTYNPDTHGDPVYRYADGTDLNSTQNMVDACVMDLYHTLKQETEGGDQKETSEQKFLMSVRKKSSTQYYDQLETQVDLVMDSDYNITAILSDTQTDDSHREDRCERKLTIPAKVDAEETVDEDDYEKTDSNGDVEEEWTITTMTRITTIYWERGVIERTHPDGN